MYRILLFVAVAVLLSACGGQVASQSPPTAPTAPLVTPFPTPSPTPLPTEIRQIKATVTVVGEEKTYFASGLELHENGFLVGTRMLSGRTVYRDNTNGLVGPYSNIVFVCSRPELCGFQIDEGDYPLGPPFYDPKRYESSVSLAGGVLTVYIQKNGEYFVEKYLAGVVFLDDVEFSVAGIYLPLAYPITEEGLEPEISGLKVLLHQGQGDGPFAYLYEEFVAELSE